jgi:hypothetical protein
MKLAISTALLVLLGALPAYAWQQPDQDKKPAQEEPKKQEPEKQKPQAQEKQQQEKQDKQQVKQQEKQQKDDQKQANQKQEQKQQKEQADQTKQNQKAQQQAAKQQQQTDKDRAKQDKASQQQAQRAQQEQNNQAQRDGGGRNARRISDADFHAHFGRAHTFHVDRRNNGRFQYGGYSFELSEPWPEVWSYGDDVYVDDIDGEYYLIDPVHPGIRILVIVVA